MAFDEAAARLLNWRPIEFTEAAAECDQVFDGELLATKQDDQMIQPGAVDFVEVLDRSGSSVRRSEFPLRAPRR